MINYKTRHIVLGLLAGGGALWGLNHVRDGGNPTTHGSGGGGGHFFTHGTGGGGNSGGFWSGITRGGFGGSAGEGGS